MSMGLIGADKEDIFPFDDDSTGDEIQSDYETWVWECISGGWQEVEEQQ